ncbi:MAG: PQQ-binding-like beta-propeller repeat protein [Bacteroidetes bacterium]|nr:PQQ-binding-like beta-propeller repeat protein [Bacteroidota bacterium]
MKTICTLLISSFLLAASCSKEKTPDVQTDENGVVIAKPILWKTHRHATTVVNNSYTRNPIYHYNNIVVHTTNGNERRRLTMLNSDNGEIIWHWDDHVFPQSTARFIDISYYFQKDHLLTWQMGSRSYCVNLNNGSTHWKIRRENWWDVRIQPYRDNYFFSTVESTNSSNYVVYKAHITDITDGETNVFLEANLSGDFINSNNSKGGVLYSNLTSDPSLIVVTYFEPLPNWFANIFHGLYNTQTNDWVWDRKLLGPPRQSSGVHTPPIVYQNRIYAAYSNSIVCHDIATGVKLWQKEFQGDFAFSGFIIEEDKIIANCEDTYTYCLNPQTGEQLWRTQSAGTSSPISYLNGVVYFAGGSTGRLHAIEVATGKMLWSINVDRLGEKGGMFSYNGIYVLPASGGKPAKVIALSGLYAYCFEAAK